MISLRLILRSLRKAGADIVAETGPMVEPLRDPAFFRRVFIEYGALAWPNGYDIDPIALYREMQQAGSLTSSKVA